MSLQRENHADFQVFLAVVLSLWLGSTALHAFCSIGLSPTVVQAEFTEEKACKLLSQPKVCICVTILEDTMVVQKPTVHC